MGKFVEYIRLLRPSQWYKNLLIPAVGIFSAQVFDLMIYLFLILGFLSACGIAGFNYIVNDILDSQSDRVHPQKKDRPIASGSISKKSALLFGSIILILSMAGSFIISFWFFMIMLLFFLIAQLYNFVLKKIAFVDVLTISMNFIVRGFAGLVIVIAYPVELVSSHWAIWGLFISALFLAISKRKADLKLLDSPELSNHKQVYDNYSKELLDHLVLMVATIMLLGYHLWVVLTDTTGGYYLSTVPVATYLMFRYLYLLFSADKHMGTPEKAIKDRGILIGTIVLLIIFLVVRYLESFGII